MPALLSLRFCTNKIFTTSGIRLFVFDSRNNWALDDCILIVSK